eukprot:TRINITY_DN8483_c0_g2_i1.p1 TRINITY_DN8483_c0_g2~~TRINITY_DN8483_c0_g2_i1.p1  ORF type:complete len:857 (-),score=150.62 TRINITY_DN8483_c0_g2_i1:72-2642(-)
MVSSAAVLPCGTAFICEEPNDTARQIRAALQQEVDALMEELGRAMDQILGKSHDRLKLFLSQRAGGKDGDRCFQPGHTTDEPVKDRAVQAGGLNMPEADSCATAWCVTSRPTRKLFHREASHSAPPSRVYDNANDHQNYPARSVMRPASKPLQRRQRSVMFSGPNEHNGSDVIGVNNDTTGGLGQRDFRMTTKQGTFHDAMIPGEIVGIHQMSFETNIVDPRIQLSALSRKDNLRRTAVCDLDEGMAVDVSDISSPSTSLRPFSASPTIAERPTIVLRPKSAAAPPLPPLPVSLPKSSRGDACVESTENKNTLFEVESPSGLPAELPIETSAHLLGNLHMDVEYSGERTYGVRAEAADVANSSNDALSVSDCLTPCQSPRQLKRSRQQDFEPAPSLRTTFWRPAKPDGGAVAGIFADPEQVKAAVRSAINREEYDVQRLYKEDGIWQAIAKHQCFDLTTLFVIAMNAIWMAVDADWNKDENGKPIVTLQESAAEFQVAEHLVCFYFTGELLIRFLAFRFSKDAFRDTWFLFDFILVSLMVFETWLMSLILLTTSMSSDGKTKNATVLRMLRMLRLLRMARLARLVRALPELMILVKGMIMAARSVLLTMLLLFLIIYVFAIAMTRLVEEGEAKKLYWADVSISMKSLLLHGCFLEGLPEVVNLTGRNSWVGATIVLFFVLLASLTVMNMLVGVLCEVVQCVASIEKETLQVQFVKGKVQGVCRDVIGCEDMIERDQFDMLLATPEAALALQEVGVDVVGLVDFGDYIFGSMDSITFGNFIETVLQLRGTNMATVKDIVDVRKCLGLEIARVERKLLKALGESPSKERSRLEERRDFTKAMLVNGQELRLKKRRGSA